MLPPASGTYLHNAPLMSALRLSCTISKEMSGLEENIAPGCQASLETSLHHMVLLQDPPLKGSLSWPKVPIPGIPCLQVSKAPSLPLISLCFLCYWEVEREHHLRPCASVPCPCHPLCVPSNTQWAFLTPSTSLADQQCCPYCSQGHQILPFLWKGSMSIPLLWSSS